MYSLNFYFICLYLGEALSYQFAPSRHSFVTFSSNKDIYDAFSQDPLISQRILLETQALQSWSLEDIRNELSKNGIRHKGLFDRKDLAAVLARYRVYKGIRTNETSEYNLKQRRIKAEKIAQELEDIQKLDSASIIKQLSQYGYSVDSSCKKIELASKLALIRLGYLKNSRASPIDADSNVFKSFKSTARKVVYDLIGSSNENKNFSRASSGSQPLVNNDITLSGPERVAKSILETEYDAREFITASELAGNFSEISFKNSFDEIKHWAEGKSRQLLTEMLSIKGIVAPKYAPLSTLAAMLADRVLVERNLHMEYTESLVRTSPALSSASMEANGSSNDTFSDLLLDISPERSLFNQLAEKAGVGASVTNMLTMFASSLDTFLRWTTEASQSAVQSSPATLMFSMLSSILGNISSLCLRVSRWAGGPTVNSSNVLTAACLFCVLCRKGIISFFGFLITIRILRLAFQPLV